MLAISNRFNDDKIFKMYEAIRVKCKHCGHTNTIPAFKDTKLCWNCKKIIQNTTRVHFNYKMRKELTKNED